MISYKFTTNNVTIYMNESNANTGVTKAIYIMLIVSTIIGLTGLIGLSRDMVEEFYFDQVRPETMVVVVSDDGPVTAFRAGEMIGRSPADT